MENATYDKHIMTDVQVAELAIHLIASLALGVSCCAADFLICSMAQDGIRQLRPARTLRYLFLGLPPGLYMALGALYSLLYGLGDLIDISLTVGPILCQFLLTKQMRKTTLDFTNRRHC